MASLDPLRRAIVAALVLSVVITIVASIHDGAVASRWSNLLGALLGCLAGTYAGERLPGSRERVTATGLVWLQMATIGSIIVGAISWQALPAYCQLPVLFVMSAAVIAAVVYIRRLRFSS